MASQMIVGFDVETSDGNAKAATIRIGNMIFSSFLRSVPYRKNLSWSEYWLFPVLLLEITLSCVILIFWTIRLVRKGKQYLKVHDDQVSSNNDMESFVDDQLFNLAKSYLKAKLNYDLEQIHQTRTKLIHHLKSEYLNYSQIIMLKRIRTSLIKNPYDQVGRRMASETKDLFLEHVIKDPPSCGSLFKIPDKLLKKGWIRKALLYSPVIFSILGLLFQIGIYTYDMHSDIKVIEELQGYEKSFKTPTFSKFFENPENASMALENFFLQKFRKYGLPVLTEPCELFDLIEEIPNDVVPLYNFLVIKMARIRWNPNLNKNNYHPNAQRNFQVYDLFEVFDKLVNIYIRHFINGTSPFDSLMKNKNFTDLKPSDAPKLLQNLIDKLKSAEGSLDTADTWNWALNILGQGIDTTALKPLLKSGVSILEDFKKDVVDSLLAEVILKRLDQVQIQLIKDANFSKNLGILDTFQDLSGHIKTEFKRNKQYSPTNDYLKYKFGPEELKCRKFGYQIMDLVSIKSLKETALKYYIKEQKEDSVSAIDLVSQTVSGKLDFLAISIIKSARFFLTLTMIWTILNTFLNFYKSGRWPLLTYFRTEYEENHPDSEIFNGEGNQKNEYVAKSANRFNFNINETIKETLSTINVQVAVWISLATYREIFSAYVKDCFDVEVTNEMFGLKEEMFTEFTQSAVFTSLIAGTISLTFAQWKQYMIRHQNDSSLKGKIVYFLTCFFNSLAIFSTQTTFYIIAFPYLTGVLLVVMRNTARFDEYDPITKPTNWMTIILYYVVVLIPLKFIPKLFDCFIHKFTDYWILHKTHHMNKRNRSGYDLSKDVHSMFLPCAINNYDHVADDEATVNPGFSYFSKDPTSKRLYRLKFEIHIFHKISFHTLYLICTFGLFNTIHLVLKRSTLEVNPQWLGLLNTYYVKSAMIYMASVIPLLLISFGFLYVYYKFCHPWVSEGISVGFEPEDNECWRPFSSQGHSEGMKAHWGKGQWHDSDLSFWEDEVKAEFKQLRNGCCCKHTNKIKEDI